VATLLQYSLVPLRHYNNNHYHLFETQYGRRIFGKWEGTQVGHHLEDDRGHPQNVRDFEKSHNGVLLKVRDVVLVICKGLKDILEGVEFDGGETTLCELESLVVVRSRLQNAGKKLPARGSAVLW
jgi:hypothetical protein